MEQHPFMIFILHDFYLSLLASCTSNRQPCDTTACCQRAGWSAEHGHVDDQQVGHQLLTAIGQGRLAEAARLDKLMTTSKCGRRSSSGLRPARCRGGSLVRPSTRMAPVKRRMSENWIFLQVPPAAAARMETAANGRAADMRMLLQGRKNLLSKM
jgi:hypothetical protein